MEAAGKTVRRATERDPSIGLVTISPRLRHSGPFMSRHTRMRMFGSVVLVGLTRLCSDFCSRLSRLCVDFHLCAPENHVYLIKRHKLINSYNIYYFSKMRKTETAQTKNAHIEKALYLFSIWATIHNLQADQLLIFF